MLTYNGYVIAQSAIGDPYVSWHHEEYGGPPDARCGIATNLRRACEDIDTLIVELEDKDERIAQAEQALTEARIASPNCPTVEAGDEEYPF